MTIRHQGGVFGRNPTFNNVTVDGVLSVDKDASVYGRHLTKQGSTTTGYQFIGDGDSGMFQQASNQLQFSTANTERLRISSTGDVTIITGNLVIGTSGKGIDFSATSGTGTSELFDDYEEGTWTPTIGAASGTSVTFTAVSATYTKIGRTVHFRAEFNGGFTSTTGYQLVSGLPFAPSNLQSGSWSSSAVASGVAGNISIRTGSDFYIYAPSATVSGGTTIFVYVTGTYQTS